jgi:hypothetical protein
MKLSKKNYILCKKIEQISEKIALNQKKKNIKA